MTCNIGVALNNAFNYISTTKQAYDALAFITDLYRYFIQGFGAGKKSLYEPEPEPVEFSRKGSGEPGVEPF